MTCFEVCRLMGKSGVVAGIELFHGNKPLSREVLVHSTRNFHSGVQPTGHIDREFAAAPYTLGFIFDKG